MKLYLSSIDIPTPNDLATLTGKPLSGLRVGLIPNAQDYYAERARDYKIHKRTEQFRSIGFQVEILDLKKYETTAALREAMNWCDVIWAMGGNTFCLRYEMRRSGFDRAITEFLNTGKVYGGDSAGALVAGSSIGGIESADIPEFSEDVIREGLGLVPYVILPHADNAEFAEAVSVVRSKTAAKNLIELADSEAVIFHDGDYRITRAKE